MSTYTPGQVVKIHRPNKEFHGCFARFIELSQSPDFVHVAFCKKEQDAKAGPPAEHIIRNKDKVRQRLLPLSQLQSVTS